MRSPDTIGYLWWNPTAGPSSESHRSPQTMPGCWSGDGRWIYFRSDRGGKRQIWRVPYTGRSGPAEHAERVTTGTAHEAFESPDGKWVYFVRQPQSLLTISWWGNGSGLWRVPTGGGPEEKVLDGVRAGAWGLAESGIFFVEPTVSRGATVHAGTSNAVQPGGESGCREYRQTDGGRPPHSPSAAMGAASCWYFSAAGFGPVPRKRFPLSCTSARRALEPPALRRSASPRRRAGCFRAHPS